MSFRSRKNSFVDHVRSFISGSSQHSSDQNIIDLGSLDTTDVLGYSLHKAAISGSRRSLKKVLLSAVCVDYPNDHGQTPLFCACARDQEANALLLLQYGANPNEKTVEGVTPTHAACCVGNIMLLGKLIEAGGDLRLHDNNGNSMRDWALQNPDHKRRGRMLEFLDKTHVCAMAYTGDAVSADYYTKFSKRTHRQTSLMEIMKMRTGSDSNFENLKRVQSMGFGKVYLGGDFTGGIVSVVPLISEAVLEHTNNFCFDTGYGTFMEHMEWLHMEVSVKQVKSDIQPEEGIDNIIAEAEYLGKLRHPNVTLMLGICQSASLENMWLIFEYFEEATLHHYLHTSKKHLSCDRRKKIIWQVCRAMEFIHNQSLIHCGLSSMAVYLVSPHMAKVGNFEFMVESIKADLGKPSRVSSVAHGRFLYNWMAPEIMREEPPTYSSDVYSFCCIIWEMFAGETPWAELDPEDIFQKVVAENRALNIDYAPLPQRFKAIVGYGLELKEQDRLHKFALISGWLKSEQVPVFERTHSPLRWINKSCNHSELSSSSSHSSSLPSVSSAARGEEGHGKDMKTSEHKYDYSKRFSLDFESPVNTAFPFSPAIDLSYLSNKREGCSASVCSSDLESAPAKPPRTFASGRFHSVSKMASFSKETRLKQSYQDNPESKISPRSPSKIKPASHSYHSGTVTGETDQIESKHNGEPKRTNSNTSTTKLKAEDESDEDMSFPKVKSIADKYQQIESQHQLRQAILKGSMAPRGSFQNLKASSESIISESVNTDNATGATNVSRNRQASELGSLCGTPLIKGSSTPKDTFGCSLKQDRSLTRVSKDQSASGQLNHSFEREVEDNHTRQNISISVDGENKTEAENLKDIDKETDDEESSISKRRTFINDIKQKYSHIKQKSLFAMDGKDYQSPVLQFHSPRTEIVEELSTQPHKGTATASEYLPNKADLLGQVKETPAKGGLAEEDSFWAVTPLVSRDELEGNSSKRFETEQEYDATCNILHADYPQGGCRVIMRAEGSTMSKTYYGERTQPSNVNDHPEVARNVDVVNVGSLQAMQIDNKNKVDCAVNDSDRAEDSDLTTQEDDHDGTFTVEEQEQDGLNETFDIASPEPLFPPNTSFGSQKVVEWVDNQFEKIKDTMSLRTDSNSSLCGVEEIPIVPSKTKETYVEPIIDASKGYSLQKDCYENKICNKDEIDKIDNHDFEFPEYYIDDELDKNVQNPSQIQPQTTTEFTNTAKQTQRGQPINSCALENKAQNMMEVFKQARTTHQKGAIHFKPPINPISKPQTENVCQSARSRASELENVSHKVLSRQSASEKDIASLRQSRVHLVAKGQPTSRGREGVPIKQSSKNLTSCDMLRSGASDPSLTTSFARESQAETRQKEDEEEDNTLAISQNFSDDEHDTNLTNKYVHHNSQSKTCRKEEACQVKLGPTVIVQRQVSYDSDSVESDVWVKEKLQKIQNKIARRKARSSYAASSEDEEEELMDRFGWMANRPTANTGVTQSWSFVPTQGEVMDKHKADRSVSCRDIGINADMYQKVLEELKVTCKDRRIESNRFTPNYTRRKSDSAIDGISENLCPQYQEYSPSKRSNTSSSKFARNQESLTSTISKVREVNLTNTTDKHRHEKTEDDDKFNKIAKDGKQDKKVNQYTSTSREGHRYDKSPVVANGTVHRHEKKNSVDVNAEAAQSKSSIGTTEEQSSIGSQSARNNHQYGFRSLQRNQSYVNSPEWEDNKSVKKDGSRRSILRKFSKESVASLKSIPLPLPRSKLKSSSKVSKSKERAISFEDVSQLSSEDTEKCQQRFTHSKSMSFQQQPSTSRRTKFVSSHASSTHIDEEESLIGDKNKFDQATKSRCKTTSRLIHQDERYGRASSTRSAGSKHSIVSFAKSSSEISAEASASGRLSNKSVGSSKRHSPRHRHETPQMSSSSSSGGNPNSKQYNCDDIMDKKTNSLRGDKIRRSLDKEEEKISLSSVRSHRKSPRDERKDLVRNETQSNGSETLQTQKPPGDKDGHYLTVGLEQQTDEMSKDRGKRSRKKNKNAKSAFGMHRFYIPKESWPYGCQAKLDVKVSEDCQHVTTTATNLASGQTETLLDEVFTTSKIKSTMQLE